MNIIIRLVDDDEEVRKSLKDYLEILGWIVKEYDNGQEFLDFGEWNSPGCIIMDLTMPNLNGIEVLRILRRRGCGLPVIFLSGTGTIPDAVTAMELGAETFLEKPTSADRVRELVVKAIAKNTGANLANAQANEDVKRFQSLTEREKEVARLIASGMLNKVIADRLGISLTTVKTHRANVFAKLGIKKAVELAKILLRVEKKA